MFHVNNVTNYAINETSTAIVETVMSTTFVNDGPLVDSDAVSPVTLSMEWSRVARLLIMIGLSVIGSIGNVYMISSVMIEDHLNKRGKYTVTLLPHFIISRAFLSCTRRHNIYGHIKIYTFIEGNFFLVPLDRP